MKIEVTSKKPTDQLEPTVFVIFGGAGDLTWRKLVPALFDLSQDRSLPAQFAIIAVDRIKLGDDALRRRLHDGVNQFSRFGKAKAASWNQFAKHIHYQQGDYDHAGALRDMVQNHLMQLLCLVAMEPMVSFQADEIRNKKVDVLHAARPISRDAVPQSAVRGQYGSGNVAGKKVPGYREENGVAPDSKTETFAALKLFLDNWRWQDVPFYLRTGKRLPQQASEISIQFRAVPHRSFPPEASLGWQPSRLVLSIQPDEGIVLGFQAKYPGPKMQLRPVEMRFSYRESFDAPSPDAYETLLWDVMKKDATLFMRADQVEAAWELLMPVLEAWQNTAPSDFPNYAAGTWGPENVQELLSPGHRWPLPTALVVAGKKKGKKS